MYYINEKSSIVTKVRINPSSFVTSHINQELCPTKNILPLVKKTVHSNQML